MINCKICGAELKFIGSHLKKHKILVKEYKEKFPDAQLMTQEQKQLISKRTKEQMHKREIYQKYLDSRKKIDYSRLKPKFDRNDKKIKEKMYSPERNKKISDARKKWWADKKGKTVEQIYGDEKGALIRETKSQQTKGEKNPAYGKIYNNSGRRRGFYKNKLFRSLWEYSYMKFLENQNISLEDVEYESIIIRYTKNNGGRTYRPDFFIVKERRLIEIKSKWHLKNDKELIDIKKQAAEKWCKENNALYQILTEDDFPILTYQQAKEDKDIVWQKDNLNG